VQHYTLRFWLARGGTFPWRAVPFLEETTERKLLQSVGGGYRFIHPLFQDYFASPDKKEPPPPIQSQPSQQP
jgi:hypothetical protein